MLDSSEFLEGLRQAGHIRSTDARLTPLSGGVSSEIYRVDDGDRRFVVKRALARLRVKDEWLADVSRNGSERAYLECVGALLPGAVPQVLFAGPGGAYFGMEYLADEWSNWKSLLLAGDFTASHARNAGRLLGTVHRETAGRADLHRQFDTTANFHQLRTSPYLLTTGERHPALQPWFRREAERLEATRESLVHGDFSPKNILVRSERLVLLDCEVAWYGDPVFDVAFLLNHLFLKRLYHAPSGDGLAALIEGFWAAYHAARPGLGPTWESRVVHLLLLLLLARVDGKSPVEYLTAERRAFVRAFVARALPRPPGTLAMEGASWFEHTATLPSPPAT